MMPQGPRQHPPFDVAALAHQVFRRIARADALDILLDDRAFVEIGCDVMGGGADQFDAARMRLVIGFGPLEARQEQPCGVRRDRGLFSGSS